MQSFEVAFGVGLRRKPECGVNGMSELTAVQAITATITVEAPAIGDKNFWAKLMSHNAIQSIDSALEIGTTAGNIVRLDFDGAQINQIQRAAGEDDIRLYTFNLTQINGNLALITSM